MTDSDRPPSRKIDHFLRPRTLILIAAVWHFCFTTAVFLVGKYQLLPNQIDPVGLAVGSDAGDYQGDCIILGYVLRNEGFRAWLTWPSQFHVRLYSLPVMFIFRRLGFNVLAIEPVNLFYYLAILFLVVKIGETLSDRRTGLLAAGIVALWPSFVFHTTQLLRDPLLIVAVLAFTYCFARCLSRELSARQALGLGGLATLAIVTIRVVRMPMWYTLCAALGVGVLLLLLRFIRRRSTRTAVVIIAAVMIVAAVITPRFQTLFHNQQQITVEGPRSPEAFLEFSLVRQLEVRRQGFQIYVDEQGRTITNGSNIDTNVHFNTMADVVRYVPRGIVIGLFAPFPNMWCMSGRQVGYAGRVLSALEMCLTYVLEGFALLGLWRCRDKFGMWFVAAFAVLGAASLGLVATNVGALYRLRYPFWIMGVILGASGLVRFYRAKRHTAPTSCEYHR